MKILVVGRGLIGTKLGDKPNVEVISHKQALAQDAFKFDVVVNCAAIAGQSVCDRSRFNIVLEANAYLPCRLRMRARRGGAIFVHLSTGGVYAPQVCPDIDAFEKPTEESETVPHNAYVESKIKGDELLLIQTEHYPSHPCYILRLPVVEEGLVNKIKKWNTVQDTYISLISVAGLHDIIYKLVGNENGLYNVDSEIIYLPDYAKAFHTNFSIRTEVPKRMTGSVPIDTTKAKKAGIL